MKTVGILIFDDVGLHTFSDAVAVFSSAKSPAQTSAGLPLFHILTIAESMRAVRCEGGVNSSRMRRFGSIRRSTFC